MGLDLAVLLAIAVLGQSTFAVFEVETPAWRKILKWGIVIGLTLTLAAFVGHWALCPAARRRNRRCRRPHDLVSQARYRSAARDARRRYYDLRGWTWQE